MAKHKIILVDDERFVLYALARSLRQEGYEIVLKANGEEALDYLFENPDVHAVVSDYRMPGMNGIEFLAAVKKLNPDIVRIMITGHADIHVAIDALNIGKLYRFMVKPWEETELKQTLQEAMAFRDSLVEARRSVHLQEASELKPPA